MKNLIRICFIILFIGTSLWSCKMSVEKKDSSDTEKKEAVTKLIYRPK